MKYMLLLCDGEGTPMGPEERQEDFARVGEWWMKHSSAGTIVSGEQLQPPNTATTVRLNGGRPVVTDGPFIEAKESIGGFAIVDLPDLDAALELAKTWPLGTGIVEVRPLVTHDDH